MSKLGDRAIVGVAEDTVWRDDNLVCPAIDFSSPGSLVHHSPGHVNCGRTADDNFGAGRDIAYQQVSVLREGHLRHSRSCVIVLCLRLDDRVAMICFHDQVVRSRNALWQHDLAFCGVRLSR